MEVRIVEDVKIFSVPDDFTFENFGKRLVVIREVVAASKLDRFLVDLSNCERVDSITLGTMVSIHKSVSAKNGLFGVIVRNDDSRQVFEITGLDGVFMVSLEVADAVAAMHTHTRAS